ncbi:GIY-YIG nuclease family protein [Echinicola vietnamensis]|uniref:Excinuclease cho n=1 Tax=Echinicola vietnamensis (strain DSM 17526 / LMG 23754 / KMM 6221) TaxID=926556 RepID=L0G2M6_ECHVK|nr:GIY-YIG nuclease family protein [Echinicola vietnamensis]AGA79543.1 putative endonuclease [Echinicola vietnamensis DSM 17526]
MLSENLSSLVKEVPKGIVGVYYLMGEGDRIIYIGKSIDIRKRLLQHFQQGTAKALRMQNQVRRIEYENMGNELMALLRESELIKFHKPMFNRALRRSIFLWGLYLEHTAEGYLSLQLKKITTDQRELMAFTAKKEGKEYLFRITDRYQLCQKINGLYPTNGACFQYSLRTCRGACVQEEAVEAYNKRVGSYMEAIRFPETDQAILLKGRKRGERGLVLIEKGVYRGYGFFQGELEDGTDLHALIEPKTEDRDSQRLIRGYLRKQDSAAQ